MSEMWVPISALQHYRYCPRQCALIHVEQVYEENIFTLQGNRVHESVDKRRTFHRDEVRHEYSVRVWSENLMLRGIVDLVEYDPKPYPVEYKRTGRARNEADEVQLSAQCMCLEEMLDTSVEKGAIYSHTSRSRREVNISRELRSRVKTTVSSVKRLILNNEVPEPTADSSCQHCSLNDYCLPFGVSDKEKVTQYDGELFVP